MGPRLFSRGNDLGWPEPILADSGLQWGHDFSAVEIIEAMPISGHVDKLQWGHDFSAVEIAVIFRPLQMSKN